MEFRFSSELIDSAKYMYGNGRIDLIFGDVRIVSKDRRIIAFNSKTGKIITSTMNKYDKVGCHTCTNTVWETITDMIFNLYECEFVDEDEDEENIHWDDVYYQSDMDEDSYVL